jgi:hypothetical protein
MPAVMTRLPPSPIDAYVSALGLDELELTALLDTIDHRLLHADPTTRQLLMPCREAIIGELRAIGA